MTDNPDDIVSFGVRNAESFTPDTRRNLIRATISRFTSQGISKTQAIQAYRDVGIGINFKDFSSIYNDVLANTLESEKIQLVSQTDIPSEEDLGCPPYKLNVPYRFTVLVTMNDKKAETQSSQFLSIDTNTLHSKAEILDFFQQTYGNSFPADEFEILSSEVVRGYKQC
jgi:hypothetical protein